MPPDVVPAKMHLATSIWVVLAIMHRITAAAIKDAPEDKPASRSPLYTDTSEIILVSFSEPWKEAHTKFARLLHQPITTWSIKSGAFIHNAKTAFVRRKKPVLVTVDTSEKPSTRPSPGLMWFTCTALAWRQLDIRALARSLTRRQWGCKAGYFRVNGTFMQSFFGHQGSSTDLIPLSKDTFDKVKPLKRNSAHVFGGRELTVACVRRTHNEGTENTCDDTSVLAILALLSRKNVTVKRVEASDAKELLMELLEFNIDIFLFRIPVHAQFTSLFDFPLIRVVQSTFYSRVDAHRVVSLLELAVECCKIVAATAALLAMLVLLSAAIADRGRSICLHISDTALFLLAAVLATSAVQPNMDRRTGIVWKALLALWLIAILPLSVYFRTELTAIVTLRRPAHRIDTLQKLEDALDRRLVAPCVVKHTLNTFELLSKDISVPQTSLSKKLRLEFARHGKEELVTSNLSDCMQCAARPDRVCYVGAWRHPSRELLKLRNVGAFVEHLKSTLVCFLMPKLEPLYWPLRTFFLAVEENKLIDWDSREPEHDNADNEFDMSGLLMLLVILHATSCLVLVLEVVVARCRRRARLCEAHSSVACAANSSAEEYGL